MIKTEVYIREGKLVKRLRPGTYVPIDRDEIAELGLVIDAAAASTAQDITVKALLNAVRALMVGDSLDSDVGLAVGTTKPNVATGDIEWRINGMEYSKDAVAAGTALAGGGNIPQSLYGAYSLDIGADEAIDIVPAAANSTGYATDVLALAGIPAVAADHVRLGTVVVIKVDVDFLNSAPSLAIGSTPANVAHAEFTHWHEQAEYTEPALAAGAVLGGDTIPQNKYGAFRFEIGADETLDVIPADDNVTGYDTPALALAGLPAIQDAHVDVGNVTVMHTDGGGFVPGTTSLAAVGVTAAYTDAALDGFFIPGITEMDDVEVTAVFADAAIGTAALPAAIS